MSSFVQFCGEQLNCVLTIITTVFFIMIFDNSLQFAKHLDEQDELKDFRTKFFIPQHNNKDSIYFCGNSLGLQPKSTLGYINHELENWASLAVLAHHNKKSSWITYNEQLAPPIANLVGALPEEVVVMNQLTVNIHLLFASFYRPTKNRFRIICEAKAFPSDQYAIMSQAKLHGFNPDDAIVEVRPREGEFIIRTEDVLATINENRDSTALVFFGGLNYYTGQLFNMADITKAAHDVGAYCGFDLAHAIGNVSMQLHEWNVDFACWCSYKYLNSGPGGIAGAYIHHKYATDTSFPRMAGWWGTNKETRFSMERDFDPIPTAEGWQLSNSSVLAMAVHKAALEIFEEAGFPRLLAKSGKLTGFLFFILDQINGEYPRKVIQLITPPDAHGCQVSMLMLEKGKEVFDALINAGVICDWREPNVIRIAPVPLYNTFEDVWRFGSIIKTILDS